MRGVSSLQKEWLGHQREGDIAVFVVWSDQLGAEPRHLPDAAALMPDPRARHYWDGREVVGGAYRTLELEGKTVNVGQPAWDTWLLFDRKATWTDSGPPKPAWWEHQLRGLPPERRLDPERFAAKARSLHNVR